MIDLDLGGSVLLPKEELLALLNIEKKEIRAANAALIALYRRRGQLTLIGPSARQAKTLVLTGKGAYLSPLSVKTLLQRARPWPEELAQP
jgi:hypothetical protein